MSFTTPCCRTSRVDDEVDKVSTAGYALGYIGGGTLLALNLAWILKPEWFGLPAVKDLSPRGHVAQSSRVFVGRGLVAGLFDPALSPRTGAAGHRRGPVRLACQSGRRSIA